MIYLPPEMRPDGFDDSDIRHWHIEKTAEWKEQQSRDQKVDIDYFNTNTLNAYARDHFGVTCMGVFPKHGADVIPDALHLKTCSVARLLTLTNNAHNYWCGTTTEEFVAKLKVVGVHVKIATLGDATIILITGGACNHLFKPHVMLVVWNSLPPDIQPFVKWLFV